MNCKSGKWKKTEAGKAWHRKWAKENRDKIRRYEKRYRDKNPDKVKVWQKESRKRALQRDPDCRRRRAMKERYNLSLEDWDRLYEEQGGRCAICRRQSKKGGLVVDHNHITDVVRGLLCHNCNLTLGKFEDKPEWFDMAAEYLRRTNAATKT